MQKVIILLSTYNGEKYLQELLNSLYAQTHKNIEIIVRDDLSTDSTLDILKRNNLLIIESKINLGAKKSFSMLLDFALKYSDGDYFMFCDQDDVWNYDKISKTLDLMLKYDLLENKIPILVHTDLVVVDNNLKLLSNSFWKYENINPIYNDLNRLLMQNTITGCTVMINKNLARLSCPLPDKIIMHDWYLGLIATAFGKVIFSRETTVSYRQHIKNEVGAKKFSYLIFF